MYLQEYETTLVLRADLPPATLDSSIERVREVVNGNGGKLLEINHWGKKKLAYEIKKQTRGIYFHMIYLGQGGTVREFERTLRLSDNVLRYLTVQLGDDVDPDSRVVKEFVRPQYELQDNEPESDTEESFFGGERDDRDDRHDRHDRRDRMSARDDGDRPPRRPRQDEGQDGGQDRDGEDDTSKDTSKDAD